MLKKSWTTLTLVGLCLFATTAAAEELEVKPTGKIFAEYHYVVSDDDGANGFDLTRGYMGLNASFGETLEFKLLSDVGHQSSYAWDGADVVEEKEHGKFEFFMKNAYVKYQPVEYFGMSFGLQGTPWTGYIDKKWKYRYVSKSFTDLYKLENTADLGISAHGKIPGDHGAYQVSLVNGEGYKKPEGSAGKQVQARLELSPLQSVDALEKLTIAGSASYESVKDDDSATPADEAVHETLFGGLLSYAYAITEDLGVSLGLQLCVGRTETAGGAQDRMGFSIFGEIALPAHLALFGRFDSYDPNTDDAAADDLKSLIIAGLSYTPLKYTAMALDVMARSDEATGEDTEMVVTLHSQFSF